MAAWTETHADRNIGLRMPPGVIGLDVDHYGSKTGGDTLAALEARFGHLPPTWVSSARPAPSGIRFYRVPLELDGREINWPGEAGKFIEIIQPGHRYAVVWPSTNPEAAGAGYEWRFEDGVVHDGVLPYPGSLAPLPDAWVRGLALSYERTDKARLDDAGQASWWSKLRSADPVGTCDVIHRVCVQAGENLRDVTGARHEAARDACAALVRLGGEGHAGAPGAVARLGEAFERAVGSERIANGEWQRLLSGAVRLAAADNSSPRQFCEHDPATRLDMELPPLPDFPAPDAVEREAASGWVDQVIEEIDALPRDERDDAVRAVAEQAAGLPEIELARARAELTTRSGMSGVTLGEFDAIVKDARRRAKEAAKLAVEQAARQRAAEQIAAKREEGSLLPPPHAPIEVARELAPHLPAAAKWWRGDYYLWDGTRYALWRDEAVDNWLYQRTADAWFESSSDEKGPAPWRPTENKINGVSHALSRGVLYHPSEAEPDDSPSQVACANGVYDVTTGALLGHTPERFNLASVPFAYDPTATAPTWEWFLNDVLPADAQTFLQEWFGYVLSGRTDLEKIANLVGRRRSGKGTIATMLEALVGADAVASPSMPSLVGTFGEQPLLGKTLAIFSDISWSFRDIVEAVEIVKKISGNDSRDVQRKNREAWHGKLGVRFMIMGNDMPRFTDASGALAGRMIHIQFPGSFYGRERPELKQQMLAELPGVLNWALAGLARLTANGRFTVPQTSEDLAAEVRRQQSPVQGFLDDTCTFPDVAPPPVPLDELHPVYRAWAKAAEVEHPLDRERFSRALASAGLVVERKMIDKVRARRVHGIAPQLIEVEQRGMVSAWVGLLDPSMLRSPLDIPPLPDLGR